MFQQKEKYRFLVKICVYELVLQVVKKSGNVISEELLLAISNRLTAKIWDAITYDFYKMPLAKFKNFNKAIFKALCKRSPARSILENMRLDPGLDEVVKIFIDEAAKKSKVRRFFAFIWKMFCCTRRQSPKEESNDDSDPDPEQKPKTDNPKTPAHWRDSDISQTIDRMGKKQNYRF